MTSRIALAASLLALGLSAWTAWSVSSLHTEVTALSLRQPVGARDVRGSASRTAEVAPAGHRILPADGPIPGIPADDGHAGTLDLDDPATQAKIAAIVEAERQRRDQQRETRSRTALRDEVISFANEVGLAPAVSEKVAAEVERRMEAFQTTRDDVRDGTITWIEARREFEEQRTTSDAALTELIGEDLTAQLKDRILPGPGPGGPPGGPPPR